MDQNSVVTGLGVGASVLGAVLVPLATLGIFARKEDVADLRAEAHSAFVAKADLDRYLGEFKDAIENVNKRVDKVFEHKESC